MEAAASFLNMLSNYMLWLLNMQGLVRIGLTASELQRTLLKTGIFASGTAMSITVLEPIDQFHLLDLWTLWTLWQDVTIEHHN